MSFCNYCGNRGANFEHCKSKLEAVAKCEYKENEMTDTKPTLDEQIKHQQNTVKIIEDFDDKESLPKEQAILASLEELKRIHEAEMPEPVAWILSYKGLLPVHLSINGGWKVDVVLTNPSRKEADHKAAEQNVSDLMAEVAQTGALLMKAERERDALIAENGGLRKDAERYRWLRDKVDPIAYYEIGVYLGAMTGIDAAIDNAIAGRK